MMSAQRFRELAEAGYNRIPVTREVLADLDTPLSTYLKLADEPWTFLLESVQGGEKWGRYSIIGLPCQERIEVRGFRITHVKAGEPPQDHEEADPLAWIEAFQGRFRVPRLDDQPRFDGGWSATLAMTPSATSSHACAAWRSPTRWGCPTSC